MRLIFIRHGDPDYEHDTVTEKGKRESKLLSERVSKWKVKEFFLSPLGRAQDTAKPSLKKMNRTAVTCPWLREFNSPIKDPATHEERIPWDLMPSYFTKEEQLYNNEHWYEADIMKNDDVYTEYKRVCDGIDGILKRNGYAREGRYYKAEKANDDTLVFFCHLGVEFVILSHLFNISTTLIWQHFFVAPSSVTVLETEEREKGIAVFRAKTIGDTSHLYAGGEPISNMGFFNETFDGEWEHDKPFI